MRLAAGSQLGAYVVLSPLGKGGMGEVYRARDTRLQRDVAIKVLPDLFASDPQRLARFEREAQLLASLNHPHIAQIHGVEESVSNGPGSGVRALVMELVEGPTLAERIQQGPLPLDEALIIARQLADALEAAHERGIIHRDLKPANIKLSSDGAVKVLDFGLAKTHEPAGTVDPVNSPTMSAGTVAGVILGTAAYMAPEQAQGKTVDRRADVWAFGVVLYEMLTGRTLFQRETVTDTLAALMTREPEWERVPPVARRLLRRCLERDPKRRLRDIGEARFLLEEAPVEAAPASRRSAWPWMATTILASVLALAAWAWRSPAPPRSLVRLDVDLGQGAADDALGPAAISADGRRLVFVVRAAEGRQVLATRLLDESRATVLEGTNGGDMPFFSPDGRWIGFFAGGKLKKVTIGGGAPIELADTSNPRGASWGDDDTIVAALANTRGLSRVPTAGGSVEQLTTLEAGEPTHRWPQILPGGKAVLFTGRSTSINSYENASIDALTLATRERKTIWRGGYFGRFVPTGRSRGHLLFVRSGELFAVPFDPERLEVTGTPQMVLDDVGSDPQSAAGRFDVSRDGVFTYRVGRKPLTWPIVAMEASGKTAPLVAKPGMYYSPRWSPDGRRLAVSIDDGRGSDIYIHDWQRGTATRLTFTAASNSDPVWAPDGKHLLYRSRVGDDWVIWWIRADGAGEPQRLLEEGASSSDLTSQAFLPDGRSFVFANTAHADLFRVTLDLTDADRPRPARPEALFRTGAVESHPAVSPDGAWLMFTSNESGIVEVYVRPLAGAAGSTVRWQVSSGGGTNPVWSRTARELFFQVNNRVMVVTYAVEGRSFVPDAPRLWSPTPLLSPGFINMDLAPDGKRFAIFPHPDLGGAGATSRMTFLLNFFDELRRRVPGGF